MTAGLIALFGVQPFSSLLIQSNPEWFKYCWYWLKPCPTGFLDCKIKPLKNIEEISIFYGSKPIYHPQMTKLDKPKRQSGPGEKKTDIYQKAGWKANIASRLVTEHYPRQLLAYSKDRPCLVPSQKPIALLEYLIITYTDEGDLVLDPVCGSGSTCVAAKNLGRHFIGIEKEKKFVEIAEKRLSETLSDSCPISAPTLQ